ncbi:hypothetical protein [Synechococcus elongatus]|uniref:hypothetical protein n=1 Tax=Synechococcus elongatus TaxID=32046 RepID=UPI0030D34D5D
MFLLAHSALPTQRNLPSSLKSDYRQGRIQALLEFAQKQSPITEAEHRQGHKKKNFSQVSVLETQPHLTVISFPKTSILLFSDQEKKGINCHIEEVKNLQEKLKSWPKSPQNRPSLFKQQQWKERQENYFLEEAAFIANQLIRLHEQGTQNSRKRFNNISLNCREWYGERCKLIAAMLPPKVAARFKIIACY